VVFKFRNVPGIFLGMFWKPPGHVPEQPCERDLWVVVLLSSIGIIIFYMRK